MKSKIFLILCLGIFFIGGCANRLSEKEEKQILIKIDADMLSQRDSVEKMIKKNLKQAEVGSDFEKELHAKLLKFLFFYGKYDDLRQELKKVKMRPSNLIKSSEQVQEPGVLESLGKQQAEDSYLTDYRICSEDPESTTRNILNYLDRKQEIDSKVLKVQSFKEYLDLVNAYNDLKSIFPACLLPESIKAEEDNYRAPINFFSERAILYEKGIALLESSSDIKMVSKILDTFELPLVSPALLGKSNKELDFKKQKKLVKFIEENYPCMSGEECVELRKEGGKEVIFGAGSLNMDYRVLKNGWVIVRYKNVDENHHLGKFLLIDAKNEPYVILYEFQISYPAG